MDTPFWMLQLLNSVQYSMLLFLLSVGLTVIFGLLHFVNLAHGALYMIGAYLTVSIAGKFGFWLALSTVPLMVAILGAVLYFGLIRHLRSSDPMTQVLVTFGLVFVFMDVVRLGWGDIALGVDTPAILKGTFQLLGVTYPKYRLFVIVVGLIVMLLMVYGLHRTPVGMMVRASVENADMAQALGIRVERLFIYVFCVGCGLAGLSGTIAAPLLSADTGMGVSMLVPTLIVVVIGGLGSLYGAICGAFIIGFSTTLGASLSPELSAILPYVLLAVILIWRPQGLVPALGTVSR